METVLKCGIAGNWLDFFFSSEKTNSWDISFAACSPTPGPYQQHEARREDANPPPPQKKMPHQPLGIHVNCCLARALAKRKIKRNRETASPRILLIPGAAPRSGTVFETGNFILLTISTWPHSVLAQPAAECQVNSMALEGGQETTCHSFPLLAGMGFQNPCSQKGRKCRKRIAVLIISIRAMSGGGPALSLGVG